MGLPPKGEARLTSTASSQPPETRRRAWAHRRVTRWRSSAGTLGSSDRGATSGPRGRPRSSALLGRGSAHPNPGECRRHDATGSDVGESDRLQGPPTGVRRSRLPNREHPASCFPVQTNDTVHMLKGAQTGPLKFGEGDVAEQHGRYGTCVRAVPRCPDDSEKGDVRVGRSRLNSGTCPCTKETEMVEWQDAVQWCVVCGFSEQEHNERPDDWYVDPAAYACDKYDKGR